MSVFECDPDESAGLAEPPDDDGMSDPDNYYEYVIKPRLRRERERQTPFQTYTLQVFGPLILPGAGTIPVNPELLREVEENLTDLLPEGYRVEIKEWSDA